MKNTPEVLMAVKGIIEAHHGDVIEWIRKMPDSKTQQAFRKWLDIEETKHSHQFITIALPTDYCLTKLHQKLEQVKYNKKTGTPKAWLKGAIACVEWHSKEHPNGGNLHIHMLKPGNYQKTKVIRDMANHFNVEKNFVNVKAGTYEDDYQHRYSYVAGKKAQLNKCEFNILDKQWRRENGLLDLYEF